MARCLQLARLGAGFVAPNPMVGAVLLYKGHVIGEGYHAFYGGPHAEVNCINSVSGPNKKYISQSTLYVSLEPCAHFGKTPPCTDLVIRHQINRVVIGCRDPFEKVNGRGIDLLQAAGITVQEGVLEEAAKELNKRFFCFHINKRPFVILKWAKTADGFIAGADYQRIKISNDFSDRWVHKMRSEEGAIMVGTNTALKDNPALTTRLWNGKSPTRVVIDKDLRVPNNSAIFGNTSRVVVVNQVKDEISGNTRYLKVSAADDLLPQLMNYLYKENINSLVVEGGSILLQSFLNAGLWDEAVVITNTALFAKSGIPAVTLPPADLQVALSYGADRIGVFKNSER